MVWCLGPLPLEPSKEYRARETALMAAMASSNTAIIKKPKTEMPKFRYLVYAASIRC